MIYGQSHWQNAGQQGLVQTVPTPEMPSIAPHQGGGHCAPPSGRPALHGVHLRTNDFCSTGSSHNPVEVRPCNTLELAMGGQGFTCPAQRPSSVGAFRQRLQAGQCHKCAADSLAMMSEALESAMTLSRWALQGISAAKHSNGTLRQTSRSTEGKHIICYRLFVRMWHSRHAAEHARACCLQQRGITSPCIAAGCAAQLLHCAALGAPRSSQPGCTCPASDSCLLMPAGSSLEWVPTWQWQCRARAGMQRPCCAQTP